MKVLIGLTTWVPDDKIERLAYLHRTLESLKVNLWTAGCDVKFVMGVEVANTPQDLIDKIIDLAELFGWEICWHEGEPMLARNLENILSHYESELYFNLQDDWVLHDSMQLAHQVRLLESIPSVGALRYFWRDKKLYMGKRVGDQTILDASGPARKGYFGHTPYLAKRMALEALRPFAPKEIQVSEAAVHAEFDVSIHHPPLFSHIGAETTIKGNTWQPIHVPESWKPGSPDE